MFGAEPHRPKHLLAPVVMPDLLEDARVVVGVAGLPPVGLAGLVEAFLAVLADRFQQPVAGLGSVFFGHYQRPRHQAGQQLEHRIWVDTLPAADRLGGLQGAAAGEHCQPGQQPLFGLGEQLVGPVDGGP